VPLPGIEKRTPQKARTIDPFAGDGLGMLPDDDAVEGVVYGAQGAGVEGGENVLCL
jgi:hypothetical protein